MTVEITGYSIDKGLVRIYGNNVEETNLERMERTRMDMEQEVVFAWDTTKAKEFTYFRRWLKAQKITRGCGTYGAALKCIRGIITTIPNKYREFD